MDAHYFKYLNVSNKYFIIMDYIFKYAILINILLINNQIY